MTQEASKVCRSHRKLVNRASVCEGCEHGPHLWHGVVGLARAHQHALFWLSSACCLMSSPQACCHGEHPGACALSSFCKVGPTGPCAGVKGTGHKPGHTAGGGRCEWALLVSSSQRQTGPWGFLLTSSLGGLCDTWGYSSHLAVMTGNVRNLQGEWA